MNNEIKEILDKLGEKSSIYKFQINQGTSFNTDEYEASILLDYITNLQEENEDLREENKEAHDFDKTMKDIKDNLIARINRQECEIHNLQQEKDSLDDYNRHLHNELKDYKSRNKKAIEYIDKNIIVKFNKLGYKTDTVAGIVVDDLLEILKGSDKE